MIEIIVSKEKKNKQIVLIENGKLVEIYEEDQEKKETEGNIYLGVIKDILPGMQSAFVDIGTEKNSFIHLKDILPQIDQKKETNNLQEQDIRKVIKRNDKILVQVKKDSNAKKGARISTHLSITGIYCILMPNTEIITVSQKIENEKEKDRLIQIVRNTLPVNMGAVIRTAANQKSKEEIEKDVKILLKEWEKIQQETNKCVDVPKLIYKYPSIIEKLIIDMVDKKIDRIICNNKEDYELILNQLTKHEIQNDIKLELNEKENIMQMYEIEKQKEKITARKIWLNCGGFITIDPTEALTAIDVNTGKFMGKTSLEETVYKVNYEATIEIAKQLRLRDIGGIIIIDYIDMHKEENKAKIEQLLKQELKNDRAKTQVEGFTKLDLMELTRKHICSHRG